MQQPLLPVGRDCDCGFPLVWHHGEQRCCVYGTHSYTRPDDDLWWRRDTEAEFASLVDALDELPSLARRAVNHRRKRAA